MAKVNVDTKLCIGCGTCVKVCPVDVFELKDKLAVIKGLCMGCSYCETECPVLAISVDRAAPAEGAGETTEREKPISQMYYSAPSPFESIYEGTRQ